MTSIFDDIVGEILGGDPLTPPRRFADDTARVLDEVFNRGGARPWRTTARPGQIRLAEGDEFIRLAMAGRGWGKGYAITNALAEWATEDVGDYCAISPTLGDARKILTEGPSGLLPALGDDLLDYNKSSLVLYLRNGSRIILASGERPDRLRGLNLRGGIIDELASFPPSTVRELWDAALLPSLRIGERPRLAIATTPRRSSPILRELIDRNERGDPAVLVIRGSTFDNADNLSQAFLDEVERRYQGTALGRQEIEGELLSDVEGALVTTDLVESTRVTEDQLPDIERIMIGVDPAVTSNKVTSDHTGIIAVGIGGAPTGAYPGPTPAVPGKHLYMLDDVSLRARPEKWALAVLELAEKWAADGVTTESNQGGELVTSMVQMVSAAQGLPLPRLVPVWASRSKYTRAEPVAGLWQQGRVHVLGGMPELTDSWVSWVPGDAESPDRLDASVHAAVGLMPELGTKAVTPVRIIA